MSEPTFPPSDPRRTAASPWQRRLGVLLATALLCGALPAQAQSGGSTRKPARTPATPKVAPAPAPVTPAAPATPAAVVPGAAVAEAAAAPASRRGGDHIVAIVNRELVTNSEVQLRVARIEQEAARSGNAGELIAALKKAYPQAGLSIALDIGAKVNKGEMKW